MIEEIRKNLVEKSSLDGINTFKYFHKTGQGQYAEQDEFLGISVPEIRKIIRENIHKCNLKDIEELLASNYHEERLCALLMLIELYDIEKAREQIIAIYLNNTKYINGWDLVDLSAPKILGRYVYETNNYDMLLKLAKSEDMWEQRIAIVSNLYSIRYNKFDCILEIADMHLNTKHDLIQKAIGWMLREVGKRDYDIEYDFLKKRYKNMPRTMLRYSIEKFEKETYRKFLKGEIKDEL